MAVTRTGRTLKLTQALDSFVGRLAVFAIKFMGTGLNVGDKLSITDINGSLVCEHVVTSTTEDLFVLNPGKDFFMNGIKVANMPASFPVNNAEVILQLR